ncbi:hypothetical protein PUN28_003648 [Cardiocondyla obscurior]|uniref:Uncharacterized protein n=1 Tax=Cardiocondyla obscurior TaxID=286306 RepID=A0AAW2GMW0_9HYME
MMWDFLICLPEFCLFLTDSTHEANFCQWVLHYERHAISNKIFVSIRKQNSHWISRITGNINRAGVLALNLRPLITNNSEQSSPKEHSSLVEEESSISKKAAITRTEQELVDINNNVPKILEEWIFPLDTPSILKGVASPNATATLGPKPKHITGFILCPWILHTIFPPEAFYNQSIWRDTTPNWPKPPPELGPRGSRRLAD